MTMHLVVVRAFGPYAKGEVIADPAAIAEVLGSEQARNVVRVQSPAVQEG